MMKNLIKDCLVKTKKQSELVKEEERDQYLLKLQEEFKLERNKRKTHFS